MVQQKIAQVQDANAPSTLDGNRHVASAASRTISTAAEAMAQIIGVDWGTSSFRAYLMAADGTLLDKITSADGILSITSGDFPDTLQRLLSAWLTEYPDAPVVMSGMIGSRNGWVEAPYCTPPVGKHELARMLVESRAGDDRSAVLVPGVSIEASDRNPDVMRGEETQIVGSTAVSAADATVVLPGTHTKWVQLNAGRITDFQTYMTGEVFAALKDHTILKAFAEDGATDDDAFAEGVARFAEPGSSRSLLAEAFSARTRPLMDRMTRAQVADYLSGLVIGAELLHALDSAPVGPVHLIGRSDLCHRYASALGAFGREVTIEPDGAAARGQFAIARAAALI